MSAISKIVGKVVGAATKQDPKIVKALKDIKKYNARQAKVDAADKAARLKTIEIAKQKKADALAKQPRIQGPSKRKPVTAREAKMLAASKKSGETVTPKEVAELRRNLDTRNTAVTRKVAQTEKARPRKKAAVAPVSKNPKLSNETKKLLEKFQRSVIEPPTTRTSLGGQIGEARPLAAGQRARWNVNAMKERPVRVRREDPEALKKARIDKAKAAKDKKNAHIKSMRNPKKPAPANEKQKLTPNNKRGRYDKDAREQDLEGSFDVQTVRGKKYPDGYKQKPSRDTGTIESRTSQHVDSRGRNLKDKPTEEEVLQRKADASVRFPRENKYPAAEGTTRRVRVTPEARLAAVKRQVRAKRAEEVARKARAEVARKKLSAKKKIAIKKDAKATLESSKK